MEQIKAPVFQVELCNHRNNNTGGKNTPCGCHESPADTCDSQSDKCSGIYDNRPRRHLGNRNQIRKFGHREPRMLYDNLLFNQRKHRITTTEAKQAHLKMTDTRIDAPKMFREMHDIEIENVEMNDADEVFWRCQNLNIRNLKLHGGTYPFMFSSDIRIDGLESDSKYVFQYVKNVELRNAKVTTKDAFWEVENVTIYDSELNGEYLGWHSHNLRLVNCHITGEQPLCYAHDLVLENCTFGPDCDRAFEYSSVQATIKGAIGGVKNPRTGSITAESYGEIILDENIKAPADCELKLWDEKTCFTD